MTSKIKQERQLTVVYGGQWGSESKGQIIAKLAETYADHGMFYAVRVGGPNAGHTAIARDGKEIKAQTVPIPPYITESAIPVIGASGIVDPHIMIDEWDRLVNGVGWNRDDPPAQKIIVDRNAVIITERDQLAELELKESIGSTGEGVGAATAAKAMRRAMTMAQAQASGTFPFPFARVEDTVTLLSEPMFDVFLEGTQGYHLSLNRSPYYPFCTSRDCGPDDIISQAGTSPRAFEDVRVVCVFRTYPIRVGGNSGPLPGEITWEELSKRAGVEMTPERTTVTKKIRRIAEWDWDIARATVAQTRPTEIALAFLDYVNPEDAGVQSMDDLSATSLEYVETVARKLGTPVTMVSTGAGQANTFYTGMYLRSNWSIGYHSVAV